LEGVGTESKELGEAIRLLLKKDPSRPEHKCSGEGVEGGTGDGVICACPKKRVDGGVV